MEIITLHYKGRYDRSSAPIGKAVILNEGVEISEIREIAEQISRKVKTFGGNSIKEFTAAVAAKGTIIGTDMVTIEG